MHLTEIVAAVINNVTISTDLAKIDAARSLGSKVDFITRGEAKSHWMTERSTFWQDLASAATIFLTGNGQVYRCRPL